MTLIYILAGPPGNGTPSEKQLLDAYYAEARRLIDAPDLHRNPGVVVYVDPAIQQNFTRAYQQSVVANDRIHMLNYAKAVSCLRLITVVKVHRPAVICKSYVYIYVCRA